MAIHAQSSCTLSTITDVEAVYTYYYLSDSTITTNEAPKDGVNPPGASTITVVSGGKNYVWQITEPQLDIQDDVIQTAVGKLYYIECVKFSDGTYDWGPLMTSSTYAAAKAAYNLSSQALTQAQAANDATALLGGHFIYNTTWSTNKTPHSANVVQNIGADGIYEQTPSQWQYNTHVGANGIKLRYNEIDLSSWTDSGLIFYNPSQSSQGKKMMELSSSALKFFDVNDSTNPLMSLSGQALNFYQYGTNTAAATLDSNGLKIVKGSIKLGSNFEVNSSGVLIAKSGTIGGWTINSSYGIYTNGKTTATSTNTGILIQKDGAIYAGAYNSTNQACPFQVTSAGALTATSGSIAGWSFNGTSLYKNNTTPGASSNTMVISTGAASRNSIGGSSGDHDWMLSAGTGFGVTTNGVLYATGAHITGVLNITDPEASNIYTISAANEQIKNTQETVDALRGEVATQAENIADIQEQSQQFASSTDLQATRGIVDQYLGDNGAIKLDNTGILLSRGQFQLLITSQELDFLDAGQTVASLSNQALNITSAIITSNLTLGPFKWVVSTNRLTLMRI